MEEIRAYTKDDIEKLMEIGNWEKDVQGNV